MSGEYDSHENVSVSRAAEGQNRSLSRRTRDGIRGGFGRISRRQFLGVTAGTVAFTGSVSAQESEELTEEEAEEYWQEVTDQNWGYEATQLNEYHERFPNRRGEGVDIAVIDSGFDKNHPLFNPIEEEEEHLDYHINVDMNNSTCFSNVPLVEEEGLCSDIHDTTTHGTNVTGLIWQAAPNANYIIIRLAPIEIEVGSFSLPSLPLGPGARAQEQAIEYLMDDVSPDVIITSLGIPRNTTDNEYEDLDKAFNDAANDAVVAAAAGDSTGETTTTFPVHPSTADGVLSVSSTTRGREISEENSPARPFNNKPDVAAPGKDIWTILHNKQTSDLYDIDLKQASGSSGASPCVAGIAALLSYHGDSDEVREAILNSAEPIQEDSANLSGEGEVRMMAALGELRDNDEEEDDSEEPDDSGDEDDEEGEPEEPEDEEETDDGEDTDPEDDDVEEETAGELTVTIIGTNGPVSEGDTLEVTAEVENTGDTEHTQTIQLFIGTEGGLDFVAMDDETVTVAGGDSQTISLGYEVSGGPDADLIARVIGEDDSDETTITTSGMGSSSLEGEETII